MAVGYEIEQVPIGDLRPYEKNAKEHTREQLDAVEASIREFGFRNPVLAWHAADGAAEIVAGHARVEAAHGLGMAKVPVMFVDDLTDAQRRALTLADNQTTMMTGWDEDTLSYELDVLAGDFDMAGFGFDLEASEDGFGTDFEIPDGDAPQAKSMELQFTEEQWELVQRVLETVEPVMTGGNGNGNKVCEVCRLWEGR
ncbi:ParB/Srx family N-terminal domain-containing protein [Olsenella urininfantis]|uniref:ParB/Srx family N-terminal domain-containing protein n=1 Tax=Olsenella urininfantis TaxID=1871033 RepID=UPI0009879224|nr:ParB/Srx family N-terminal domain-containing protein [Olsenella urininfantis]